MSPSPRPRTRAKATKGPSGLPLTVTVVICTRGQSPTLLEAVRSATSELGDGDGALVVVDGGPMRRTDAAAVADIAGVVTQPAAGLAVARQLAVDTARTDLLLFLDDDEIARPGWRAAHTAAFADERAGAAGGTIVARWPRGT